MIKPKLTLEMGIMVVPALPVTGAPTTVFTSTMLRMLSMVFCIMLSMGCCIFFLLCCLRGASAVLPQPPTHSRK
jgi:hypothetical protein